MNPESRLTQTQDGTTGTPIESYAYDATGNRTALTTSAGTASYTYPATSHRLTTVDGEVRSHDAAGNTTGIGGKTFTYNDANRMNAVKQGSAVLESYSYNHRGERVLRTPASGAAQITLYDEAGQWLGNYSATGQAQQQAIWLDNYPVALISVPSAGVPELAYIQPDHLGTPRVVIDPVRNVAIWEWNNKSEVFGNQIPSADPEMIRMGFRQPSPIAFRRGDGTGASLALAGRKIRRQLVKSHPAHRWQMLLPILQLEALARASAPLPMPRRGSMLRVPRPGRRCSGRQTDADSVEFKRRGVRQEDFWGAWPW